MLKQGKFPGKREKFDSFKLNLLATDIKSILKGGIEETQSQNITAVMPRAKTGILCIHKNHVKAFTSLIAS